MALEKNAKGLFEVTIDDHFYEFSVWNARQALKTLIEVADIGGGFLAKGAALFNKPNAMQSEVDTDALSGVVAALVQGMTKDENKTVNLVERLATNGVSRDGKEVNFSRDFERNFTHLFKVVRAALEVQYGNFFDAAKSVATTANSPSN